MIKTVYHIIVEKSIDLGKYPKGVFMKDCIAFLRDGLPLSASIIISLSLMLFLGYLMTRLTKLARLPNVTAYIITGVLIGPYFLDLIPSQIISNTDFLSDMALSFIAFSVGEFFSFSSLKKNGIKSVIITVLESLVASVFVFILTYFILKMSMVFSLVLSALAASTAPASTMMTIKQTKARGDFVETLLQVVAMDDVTGLLAYSAAISVSLSLMSGKSGISSLVLPILKNLLLMALGGGFAFALKWLMPEKNKSSDNRLIISIGVIFLFCGICVLFDTSSLLGCMAMGTVYINLTGDEKLFKQLNYFSPPILLLFFVRSGLNFDLSALTSKSVGTGGVSVLLIGILYFIVRIAGKYAGAFLGCLVTKKTKEVRNYLGLALIPQAGVAIGLAALCARTLEGEVGNTLQTIILASSFLYELIGPICAKLSLFLSKSIPSEDEVNEELTAEKEQKEPSETESLKKKLLMIQQELRESELLNKEEENEREFVEAQEELEEAMYRENFRRGKFLNRR